MDKLRIFAPVCLWEIMKHKVFGTNDCIFGHQKSNKYYAETVETFVLLVDGPSVVKLMLKRRHLSAGKSHQIKCEAIGAKPQATISWWVGGKQVSIISFPI